jgi:hypothetical protein
MAGLLDDLPNYWGDNTTKDPGTGLTQADRRDPLWAGLIQGGMGLLAAGQDITPAARAQMIAQAGQTYGGIPGAMMAQRSAGAQQVLQQQQIKAGQSKLGAAERLAALAKSPEFQAAAAKLEPEERMLLQAALDAGDMAHATSILSGASRARTATAETARKDARDDAKDAAKAKAEAAKEGRYKGTIERLQHLDNLEHEPPGSQKYWAAWEFLTQDQRNPDGTVSGKMDLEKAGFAPPSFRGPIPKPPETDPNAPKPAADPNAPKPPPTAQNAEDVGWALDQGKEVVLADGTVVTRLSRGGLRIQPPDSEMLEYPDQKSQPVRTPQKDMHEPDKVALGTFSTGLTNIDKLENELNTRNIVLGPGARLVTALLGNDSLNLSNPEGTTGRALIASLTSEKIKAQSGANVTEAEFARLDKYLPKDGDSLPVIRDKLKLLKEEMRQVARDRFKTIAPGTRMNPEWRQRFGGGTAAADTGTSKKEWKIGDKWTDPAGRKWVVAPDGSWKGDD